MTRDGQLAGAFGDSNRGVLDDDFGVAIGEALEGLRQDPEDFAAGVRDRIAERETTSGPRPGPTMFSAWVRNAAAFMPPFLIPRGAVLDAGLATGGLAVKKSVWKWAPGIVAFPAILSVMLVATFVWGFRRATIGDTQGSVDDLSSLEARLWWKQHRLASVVVIVGLVMLLRTSPFEAVAIFAILSMFALLGIFGALARAGLASRAEIGQRTGQFLHSMVIYAYFLMSEWMPSHAGGWSRVALPLLPVIGGSVCLWLAQQDRVGWATRRNQRVLLPIFTSVAITFVLFFALAPHHTTREQAAEYVERGFLTEEEFGGEVVEVTGTYRHLAETKGSVPDIEPFHQALLQHLEHEEFRPAILWDHAASGLLPDRAYDFSRDAKGEEKLTEYRRPLRHPQQMYFHIANRIREESLSDRQRDRIARQVVDGAQGKVPYDALEELSCRVAILDLLDRPKYVEQLAEPIELALLATWAGAPPLKLACFVSSPNMVKRDSEGVPKRDRFSFVHLPDSDHAVRLMLRFGVPAGVQVRALAAYLVEMSENMMWTVDGRNARAAAVLERMSELNGGVEPLDGSAWTVLLDLRMVIAVAVLVSFCVLITKRAPMSTPEEC